MLSIAEQLHRATVITVALCHGSKVKPLSLQLHPLLLVAIGKLRGRRLRESIMGVGFTLIDQWRPVEGVSIAPLLPI